MIEFIEDSKVFERTTIQLSKVCNINSAWPNNMFNDNFKFFECAEFDFIYSEAFFSSLVDFLKRLNEESFTFYTLNPQPHQYFYHHFKKYSVANIPVSNTYEDYNSFLNRDPNDSPADALTYNSETVVIFSQNSSWAIIGSKDWEVAIIAFSELSVKHMFVSSMNRDIVRIVEFKDRFNQINANMVLTDAAKNFYFELINNHQTEVK